MSTPTVRISEGSYQVLKELAEQTGLSMMEVLDKALDAYRRKVFFERMNAGYAALRADPEDEWVRRLRQIATDCGVALSDDAVSSEGLYE